MVSKHIFQKNNFVRKINGFKTYFSKNTFVRKINGFKTQSFFLPKFYPFTCSESGLRPLRHVVSECMNLRWPPELFLIETAMWGVKEYAAVESIDLTIEDTVAEDPRV